MPPDGTITEGIPMGSVPGGGGAGLSAGGLAGGAIGGIASGVGNMIAAGMNSASAEKINAEQMAFNADQADINRKYQTEMSNTAYQRAVADEKAAGINPMLAYMQGGASTPSGSTANSGSLNVPRPGDAIKGLVDSGISTARDVAQTQSNLALNEAAIAAKVTEAELNSATAKNVYTQQEGNSLQNLITEQRARAAQTITDSDISKAKLDKTRADMQNKYEGMDQFMNRTKNFLDIGSSAFDIISPKKSIGGALTPPGGPGNFPGTLNPQNLTPAQQDWVNKSNFYNQLRKNY